MSLTAAHVLYSILFITFPVSALMIKLIVCLLTRRQPITQLLTGFRKPYALLMQEGLSGANRKDARALTEIQRLAAAAGAETRTMSKHDLNMLSGNRCGPNSRTSTWSQHILQYDMFIQVAELHKGMLYG